MWYNGGYSASFKNEPKEWEFDSDVIEDGKCPEMSRKVKVTLSLKSQRQIKTLCRLLPSNEWLAGLVGSKKEDGTYHIDELQLFEQKVNGCFCEYTDKGNEDRAKTPNLIGWIHSHNNMGVFFSTTDVKTAKQNIVSIVVNNKGEYFGRVREDVKCGNGRKALLDIDLYVDVENEEEIAKLAETLILKPSDVADVKKWTETTSGIPDCLYCGCSCGKRNKQEVKGGFVHKKCFKHYSEACDEAEELCDECEQPEESCIYDLMTGHCMKCWVSSENCECEDKDVRYERDLRYAEY